MPRRSEYFRVGGGGDLHVHHSTTFNGYTTQDLRKALEKNDQQVRAIQERRARDHRFLA